MKKGTWYYESDGEQNARTHYCWRNNSDEKGGIERRDFATRTEAIKFANAQWYFGGPVVPPDGNFYTWRRDNTNGRMYALEKRIFNSEEAARKFIAENNPQ